ncbi:MAG: TolC family protein [Candidatus Saccharibacteria bacterium]|nr:TolC family protein [Rhodoferax sp.]
MKKYFKLTAWAAAVLVLTGCASVNFEEAIGTTNSVAGEFTAGNLALSRTQLQQQSREKLAQELLAKLLSAEDAVQLALANSPAVQTLVAQSWADMSAANQRGRIANPMFTLERMRFRDELEIGRLLSFGLLDVLTLPKRHSLAKSQVAQAQVQLTANVVDQVTQVRQAWVRAVAAGQLLQYAQKIQLSAQASAELARRMQLVGNFNKLQRARQQVFYSDSTAQLAAAAHARTATREELIRQLGLTDAQAQNLQLPDRLPDLPSQYRASISVSEAAAKQRLDVQLARGQLDMMGRSQGLNLLTSLVDVEVGMRHDTVFDNADGSKANKSGYELGIRLPLFDWGNAKRDALSAQTLAAANRYETTVRNASSQLRESYSAYRTAYDVARHYRDEIVPLRSAMADENTLRYNGMLIGVFELLADTRDQINSVMGAINTYQQFWLADAALSASIIGRPTSTTMLSPTASAGESAGH